jgi:hypothetical protein
MTAHIEERYAEMLDLLDKLPPQLMSDLCTRLQDRMVAPAARLAAVEARLDRMAEEIVTRRLRVTDDKGRTWICADARDDFASVRVGFPHDPDSYTQLYANDEFGSSGGRSCHMTGVDIVLAGNMAADLCSAQAASVPSAYEERQVGTPTARLTFCDQLGSPLLEIDGQDRS